MAGARQFPTFRWLSAPFPLWLLLALPGVYYLAVGWLDAGAALHPRNPGLMSCWLLIISMAVTPLGMMFGPLAWVVWLRTNRRYIGVAAFLYGALHTVVWLKSATMAKIGFSFIGSTMLAGWIAIGIMLAMTLTSRDRSVRKLGRNWRVLQQLIYPAGILILIHWLFTENEYLEVATYTLPLVALTIWRIWRNRNRLGSAAGE